MTNNYRYTESIDKLKIWVEEVANYESLDLNESDTRSKIIDPFLKEVLGWNEDQIHREGYTTKIGFYDYKLTSDSNSIIIEAKKQAIPFLVPKRCPTVKYKSLDSKHSELLEAIEQGIDYAVKHQIQNVVVFNGQQLAITHIPFIILNSHDDTLLFDGVEEIKNRFMDIWSVIGANCNASVSMEKLLSPSNAEFRIRNRPILEDKVVNINDFHDADTVLKGNELARYLDRIVGKYFTEIISDDELLRKCYCDSESLKQYDKQLELVLRDRAPEMGFPIEEIETSKKSAGKFEDDFLESREDTKLFVLVGGAGVGKTTFIHRFIKFIVPDEERDSLVWIYMDFNQYQDGSDINEFVYDELERQLMEYDEKLGLFTDVEVIQKIFARDLLKEKGILALLPTEEERNKERFNIIRGIKNNKELFIKRIFEYLKSKGFAICVSYDNVDQRSADIQKKVFVHANSLRELMKPIVILSLREEVYYQHNYDRTFNFIEYDVFHIPAPKVFNVLSKRLRMLREVIDPETKIAVPNSSGATIFINESSIISVLTRTFVGRQGNAEMLEMLSNRDIRLALKLFKEMIRSHNLNMDPLLTAAGMHNNKLSAAEITFHHDELIKALALKSRKHYNGNKSDIINLFSIYNDGFYSHFSKLRVLFYAKSKVNFNDGIVQGGYFSVRTAYNDFFKLIINTFENFLKICSLLQNRGLLVNRKGVVSKVEEDDYIRLGAAGNYYLAELITNYHYIALAALDTPLKSNELRGNLLKLYQKSLSENHTSPGMAEKRLVFIANHFADYLIEEEQEEIRYLTSINSPDICEGWSFIGQYIKDGLEKNAMTNK